MTTKVKKSQGVKNWVALTALFLLGLWLPVTSHDWLESAGWIHAHEDAGHDVRHEAADGIYRVEQSPIVLKAPTLVAQPGVAVFTVELQSAVLVFSPAPVTLAFHSTAPPGLAATWQFSRRTACPNQAPPTWG